MPGCVNGKCRKEHVNGIEVEIAQTCECERFPSDHVLTDTTYKYTGPRCDTRKFHSKILIRNTNLNTFIFKSFVFNYYDFHISISAVCVPQCENGGLCVMPGDTNTTITASGHSDAGTCA